MTIQYKTRQDNLRQYSTTHANTRQANAIQDRQYNTRQDNTIQCNTRHANTIQSTTM